MTLSGCAFPAGMSFAVTFNDNAALHLTPLRSAYRHPPRHISRGGPCSVTLAVVAGGAPVVEEWTPLPEALPAVAKPTAAVAMVGTSRFLLMPGVAGSAVLFLLVGSHRMLISPNHPERYMVHVQH